MKVVHDADVPFIQRKERQRAGVFFEKRLFDGEESLTDNFQFTLVKTGSDFYSPRHRHNFDQFRFQIEGEAGFDRDGTMTPGTVGYFPEGTRYGPQTNKGELVTLVLQFGGASGNGYMSRNSVVRAVQDLKQTGEFKDGVYYPNEGSDGKQQDGYEACWEHVNKRKLEYPAERFHHPVFMNSAAFAWAAIDGQPGVSEKLLGSFDEYGTGIRFVRIGAGATLRAEGRRLYYALSGSGTAGGEAWTKGDVIHTGTDERHEIRAAEAAEFYVIMMPQFKAQALARAA
jgi:hypothetical protein